MNALTFVHFRKSVVLLPTILLFLGAPLLHAQLTFETTRHEHAAQFGEAEYVATFPFRNDGETTVTVIGNPRSTCGCTVAALAKKVYEPGESGALTATFTYGDRTGRQHKSISIETDHGGHRLSIEVAIPSPWTLQPRIHSWRLSEPAETKSFTLQFDQLTPTEVTLATFPEERYLGEATWDPETKVFTAHFTPRDLSPGNVDRAHIEVLTAEGKTTRIPVFLRIF